MKRCARSAAGLAAALALAGCAQVAPWERDRLAQPHMALDPDPALSGYAGHVHQSREAATGARGGHGGACGCY
jgi:hypothetical protein